MIDGRFSIDYQVHSTRSHDGMATIREQCLRALEMGLDEIGFTEHKDFDPADPAVGYFDYACYSREIEQAREEFDGRLVIRKGVEIDYQHWFEEEIRRYLDAHEFDLVLGSVHYVDRMTVMSPEYVQGKSAYEAYRRYFDAVAQSMESGLFDVLAHLEYANRRGVPAYGEYDPAPYTQQLSDIFGTMLRNGAILEINTAGLRHGAGHCYPCEQHVSLWAQLGGREISIGSDSHDPADLAANYTDAADIACRNGIFEVCSLSEGTRVPRSLVRSADVTAV